MTPTLYGNAQSGHAYKVALALTLTQIDYDYVWVDIDAPCETRPKAFQDNSRWCEVPLLMIDGLSLTQSGAILQYLARSRGVLGGEEHLQAASEWVIWEANRIGMCIPQLIQAQSDPVAVNAGAQDWLRARFMIDRARLDSSLEGSKFLLGEWPTIADIAVFGYVSKAHLAKLDLTLNIERWISQIHALPYFQSAESLLASRR